MHFVREIYDNMETGICILRHVSQSFLDGNFNLIPRRLSTIELCC